MFLYDSGKKVEIGVDAIKIITSRLKVSLVYSALDSFLDLKFLNTYN